MSPLRIRAQRATSGVLLVRVGSELEASSTHRHRSEFESATEANETRVICAKRASRSSITCALDRRGNLGRKTLKYIFNVESLLHNSAEHRG